MSTKFTIKFNRMSKSNLLVSYLVTLASAASLASFATRGLFSATARNRRSSSLSRSRDWGESRVSLFRQRFHSHRLTMASAQQYSTEEIHKMSDQEKKVKSARPFSLCINRSCFFVLIRRPEIVRFCSAFKLVSDVTLLCRDVQDLEGRVQEGETVVKGGTGGKSLEAQLHLAEGRHKGGERGGQARAEQIGSEGYQEMGRKGGLSTTEQSGGEAAAEKGIDIDESKYRTTK
ncbi:unnamed protein product [Closterium sp. NIES-53]